MAREETLVPSLTFAREVGDRKLVPLVGQREGKNFLPCSVIKEGKEGGIFLPLFWVSHQKNREKKREGRREEEGKKKK